jgi:flagellar hook assembly protein FlgD
MKTLSRKLFAILFAVTVLFSSSAFANGEKDDKGNEFPLVTTSEGFAYSMYAVKESLKFRLNFENQEGSNVTINIFDANGKLAFTETIKREKTSRRSYDLSSVGKGIYKVEIITGGFRTVKELGVGTKTTHTEFSAYLSKSLNDGALKVAYQNADSDGVNIVLRDEKGNVVYDEYSANEQYSRKFNLSKLSRGTYTMSVSSGAKTIEQTYKVQ